MLAQLQAMQAGDSRASSAARDRPPRQTSAHSEGRSGAPVSRSSAAAAATANTGAGGAGASGDDYYDDDFEDDFEEPEPSSDEDESQTKGNGKQQDDSDGSNEEESRRDDRSRAFSAAVRDMRPRLASDVLEALQATREENSRATLPLTRPTTASAPDFTTTATGVLDFAAARRRQKAARVASKASLRWQDLSQVITLDQVWVPLLDLAPQDGYSLFMRGLGRGAARHAAVQSTQDRVERDQQTDVIETVTAWTQQPPSDLSGTGSTATKAADEAAPGSAVSSRHFVDFVRLAGSVCNRLLDESAPPTRARKGDTALSSGLSADCVRLSTGLAFLAGRPVCALDYSPASSRIIVTASSTPPTFRNAAATDKTRQYGFLCVWNTASPTVPSKILVLPSLADPTTCCFGPPKGVFVFAADTDGVVSVWDLRESADLHLTRDLGTGGPMVLRFPSYSTASLGPEQNHVAPIVFLRPFAVSRGPHAGDAGDSMQLASFDQDGMLRTWLVAELPSGVLAGNDDQGLLPGARVRLVPASSLALFSPRASLPDPFLQASAFAFFPDRPNHCLVATTAGHVLRRVRFGQPQSPRQYTPLGATRSACLSLAFSPFSSQHFLAGYADGSIALFSVDFEHPLVMWADACPGARTTWVGWSPHRPCVFFVLDSQSRIYVWDVALSPSGPTLVEQPALRRGSVDVSERLPSLLVAAIAVSTATPPELAVACGTGLLESHRLPSLLSGPRAGELDELRMFLSRSPCTC